MLFIEIKIFFELTLSLRFKAYFRCCENVKQYLV